MDAAPPKPIVFRNNWIFVAFVFVAWLVFAILALCLLIAAIVNIFPLKGYDSDRLEILLALLSLSLTSATGSAGLWSLGRTMAYAQAHLDSRGVDFLLGTKKNPQQDFFAWDQIATIQRDTGWKHSYTVRAKDNRSMQFNMFNFFRPAAVAHQIAAHAGQSIQQIKS
jgi:hypothetical protein